ncbi:MAG: glycosyltransferase family 4 protein [Mesorhizobium sp.]|uniref:glycosyltransferase family 4 protein n=1 Tax=Mesorhizobium sp. TaxID=1871066 RepID=UPI001228DB5A|nr:glycosyltransferase family 4 protein [Mesorhizobium sp.]TIM29022.1 MAG: glycosyltransferase family 4 protein [Mesorhizobium sp.]
MKLRRSNRPFNVADKLLLVGPSHSPVTGQSAMFQEAVNIFPGSKVVRIKGTTSKAIRKFIFAGEFLCSYFRKVIEPEVEIVYVTVSRSLSGFLRDFTIYSIAIACRKKVVFHCHGGDLDRLFKRRIFGRIAYCIYRRAHVVIFLNRFSIPSEMSNSSNVTIIDNCYQGLNEITTDQDPASKWTRAYRRVTYVGNFIREKGLDDVLDVIEKISERGCSSDFLFVAAGKFLNDPDFEAEVRLRAAKMKNLRLIANPERSQLELELRESNFLLFPSRYPSECQPLVVIEAFVAGVIPLITNVNGIREQFSDFSFLEIRPRDSAAVADMLVTNLRHDFSEMTAVNRNAAIRRFSREKFRESLVGLISSHLRK